jgi:hypothetical protein
MLSALVQALFHAAPDALLDLLSLVGLRWSWDDEERPPEVPPNHAASDRSPTQAARDLSGLRPAS